MTELLILYEQHGGIPRSPDHDRYLDLSANGPDRSAKEDKEMSSIRNELIKNQQGLKQALKVFKSRTRKVTAVTLSTDQAALFRPSKADANRLAPGGIIDKIPTIRTRPLLTSDQAANINEALMRQSGIRDPARLRKLREGISK